MRLIRDEENSLVRVDATDEELDMLADKLAWYFERLPHHDEFGACGQSETKLGALFRRALLSSRPKTNSGSGLVYHPRVDLYSTHDVRNLLMDLARTSYYKKVTIYVSIGSDGEKLGINFMEKPSAYFGVPDPVIDAITVGRNDLLFTVVERKETDARSFEVIAKRSEHVPLAKIIRDKIEEEFV